METIHPTVIQTLFICKEVLQGLRFVFENIKADKRGSTLDSEGPLRAFNLCWEIRPKCIHATERGERTLHFCKKINTFLRDLHSIESTESDHFYKEIRDLDSGIAR